MSEEKTMIPPVKFENKVNELFQKFEGKYSREQITEKFNKAGKYSDDSVLGYAKSVIASEPVQGAMRVIDYPAGLVRGAIGGIAEGIGLTDKNLVNLNEVLAGNAPTFSKMMEREGIPTGARVSDYFDSVNKGDFLDFTARGAGGATLDALFDPLNALGGLGVANKGAQSGSKLIKGLSKGKLVKGMNKMDLVVNPGATAVNKMGKKLYESGIKNVTEAVEAFGGKSSKEGAEILGKHGVSSTAVSMRKQADSIIDNSLNGAEDIINEVTKQKVPIDVNEAFGPTMKKLDVDIADNNFSVSEKAKKLKNDLMDYIEKHQFTDEYTKVVHKDTGNVDLLGNKVTIPDERLMVGSPGLLADEAIRMKQNLYKDASSNAFKHGTESYEQGVLASAGKGLKTQIEKAIDNVDPKTGAVYKEYMNDASYLLSMQKAMGIEAKKEIRRNVITVPSAMMWSAGGPKMLAATTAANIAKSPVFRTQTGKALQHVTGKAQRTPIWDALMRSNIRENVGNTHNIDERR